MHSKARNYSLVFCLFVFALVIIGGGLLLNPGGALLAAATGTPLVIGVFNRRFNEASRSEEGRAGSFSNEVACVSRKTDKSDERRRACPVRQRRGTGRTLPESGQDGRTGFVAGDSSAIA